MRSQDFTMTQTGRYCILMALYNGAKYLEAQLDSFSDQSVTDWDLLISDDGSTDESLAIIATFAERMRGRSHSITVVKGPKKGFAMNFLSLIARVSTSADWIALSDQDDVWLPEKLERGKTHLARSPVARPALYCSRTWICDANLGNRRLSEFPARLPGFRNALVQNIAAGNTIMLNRAACDLARNLAGEIKALVAHDWWLYQLITGIGGDLAYDIEPTLLYRQHKANNFGANSGWRAHISRLSMVRRGQLRDWNEINIVALQGAADQFSAENQTCFRDFAELRRLTILHRLHRLYKLGLYRQSRLSTAAFWLAAGLRRI
ncbi:MAG: glycosyltransferase family 2 protein [Halocynthiibacter sp.]